MFCFKMILQLCIIVSSFIASLEDVSDHLSDEVEMLGSDFQRAKNYEIHFSPYYARDNTKFKHQFESSIGTSQVWNARF